MFTMYILTTISITTIYDHYIFGEILKEFIHYRNTILLTIMDYSLSQISDWPKMIIWGKNWYVFFVLSVNSNN